MYRVRFKRGDSEVIYSIENEKVKVENSLINLLKSIGINIDYFLNLILRLIKNKETVHSEYIYLDCEPNVKLILFDLDIENNCNNEIIVILLCENYKLGRIITINYINIDDILISIIKNIIKENQKLIKLKIFQKYYIFLIFNIIKNIIKEVHEEVRINNDRIIWSMRSKDFIVNWPLDENQVEIVKQKKIL